MASFRFSDYSDSPTILLPPSQHPFNQMASHHSFQSFDPLGPPSSQWILAKPQTPIASKSSRKRSREEDHNEQESIVPTVAGPSSEAQQAPIYGEGMTLMNPSTGLAISVESQTGTWYEEQFEGRRQETQAASERVAVAQRQLDSNPRKKLARLDRSSAKTFSIPPPRSASFNPSSNTNLAQSDHDQISLLLGIGWVAIGGDTFQQAAARGWARYLENHYLSLNNVRIILKNEGLNATLVQADPGYFLFSEDLSAGRLVASNEEDCLKNLRSLPMAFEDDKMLRPDRTMGAVLAESGFTEKGSLHASVKSLRSNPESALVNNNTLPGKFSCDMEVDSESSGSF